MTEVTIIIPFLNEGREPLNTLDSILKTTNHRNYKILFVHDSPNDPEFINELSSYNDKIEIQLIKNKNRMGVGGSRNVGIMNSQTRYVIIMDAHMRFKDNNWFDIMLDNIKKEPNTIFSALSTGAKEDGTFNGNWGWGCDILFKNLEGYEKPDDSILSPKWMKKVNSETPYEVPCVMGACYIMSVYWLNYIKKFDGLSFWGSGEPTICLKTWLMGGKCKMIPEAKIGHIYRIGSVPYELHNWYKFYNKMFLIYTLFPEDMIEKGLEELGKNHQTHYIKAMDEFIIKNDYNETQRKEIQKLLVHDIKWYIDKWNYEYIF